MSNRGKRKMAKGKGRVRAEADSPGNQSPYGKPVGDNLWAGDGGPKPAGDSLLVLKAGDAGPKSDRVSFDPVFEAERNPDGTVTTHLDKLSEMAADPPRAQTVSRAAYAALASADPTQSRFSSSTDGREVHTGRDLADRARALAGMPPLSDRVDEAIDQAKMTRLAERIRPMLPPGYEDWTEEQATAYLRETREAANHFPVDPTPFGGDAQALVDMAEACELDSYRELFDFEALVYLARVQQGPDRWAWARQAAWRNRSKPQGQRTVTLADMRELLAAVPGAENVDRLPGRRPSDGSKSYINPLTGRVQEPTSISSQRVIRRPCPSCGERFDPNICARSRADNETSICNECGMREAGEGVRGDLPVEQRIFDVARLSPERLSWWRGKWRHENYRIWQNSPAMYAAMTGDLGSPVGDTSDPVAQEVQRRLIQQFGEGQTREIGGVGQPEDWNGPRRFLATNEQPEVPLSAAEAMRLAMSRYHAPQIPGNPPDLSARIRQMAEDDRWLYGHIPESNPESEAAGVEPGTLVLCARWNRKQAEAVGWRLLDEPELINWIADWREKGHVQVSVQIIVGVHRNAARWTDAITAGRGRPGLPMLAFLDKPLRRAEPLAVQDSV